MSAYLFNAAVVQTQLRPSSDHSGQRTGQLVSFDTCASLIVYGGNVDLAKKEFERWMSFGDEQENPVQIEIKRIFVAPMVDRLFTEAGDEPIDWPQLSPKIYASLEAAGLDDFEQGYWVEVDTVVPPGKLPADVESLRGELPDEIASDLNWSPEKNFFFLVSVLKPDRQFAAEPAEIEKQPLRTENPGDEDLPEEILEPTEERWTFPQLTDKKAAALVQARNSVVAAWLWRKFTSENGLPDDKIRIDPCCDILPAENPS